MTAHPLIALERRYGREGAVGVLVVTVAVAVVVLPEGSSLAFWSILAGFALVVTGAAVAQDDGADVDDELAHARRAYVEGDISIQEFERRIEVVLDDEAQWIREVVEEVNGVGPETSSALALAFDSLTDVEVATTNELEDVHGVGPSTSEAIVEHVRGSG